VRELLGVNIATTTESYLEVIDKLNEQIASLEKQMGLLAKGEEAARLQKITGVGPIVALAFLSVIDDPKRFKSGSNVASYIGLSPGENTTGGFIRRTGVIAAGQQQMRSLLVQAAHSMLNARKTREPMAAWAHDLALRRGRKLATCALARRLAIVMWAMLRDGSAYHPAKTKPREPRLPGSAAASRASDPIDELSQLIRRESETPTTS
jgi:transposase